MNISISVNEELLKSLDDYRRIQSRIPKLSEAIRNLLYKALTELPRDSILFEGKTVSIEQKRQRFLIRFNPKDLKRLKEKGFDIEKSNKVDVIIKIFRLLQLDKKYHEQEDIPL